MQWRDSSGPQMVQHEVSEPEDPEPFPECPNELAENPPALKQALHHAMLTTEREATRYAVDHIQLRGHSGEVVATDGRQLLVQSGFEFTWQEDLLVPRNVVFGCSELPAAAPVLVGKTGKWVVFRIGDWTFYLKIATDKRFPDVDPLIPCPQDAVSRFLLTDDDARFLAKSLPRLPVDDEINEPVTVDLTVTGLYAVTFHLAGAPQVCVGFDLLLVTSCPFRWNAIGRPLLRA